MLKYVAILVGISVSAGLALLSAPQQPVGYMLGARAIMEKTIEAAGGKSWTDAQTLTLKGFGTFWPSGTQEGSYVADDYRMWRVFSGERTVAHGPDGWVRIDSKTGDKTNFQIAFDGATTWTHKGIVPPKQAARTWANNFGFGIIREALEEGFTLTRKPDDKVDGHSCFFVEIESPDGAKTLFAMDQRDYAIRYVGFDTPRGYHERRYSDFVMLHAPKWRQARRVRLFYNGVKANEIFWEKTIVDEPIDKGWFAPPEFVMQQETAR